MKILNIRALREAAGLTVPQLAASMGVAPFVVELWETNQVSPKRLDLPLLKQVLGLRRTDELYLSEQQEEADEYEAC